MSRDQLSTALLCAVLVAVGALAWALTLRGAPVVDASALATLPREIDGWRSEDLPIDSVVENALRADFNLQRAYRSSEGGVVWLYLGYYGTGRGGRPEHTPRGCYTGAGWGIPESRVVRADPQGELAMNEYVVERDRERRLVLFWYRSHRRTGMLGGIDQNLDRLAGRLLEGRADGALIRLSTPLRSGETEAARSRLLSFALSLDPLIGERWPTEGPAEETAGAGASLHVAEAAQLLGGGLVDAGAGRGGRAALVAGDPAHGVGRGQAARHLAHHVRRHR